mmetsp:Transcript_37052/g.54241  ORF Transcript_37052/g.54241 Transcript_37052/m.54241 type:complete len:136 (+) Transcript_37052:927-1334(+)
MEVQHIFEYVFQIFALAVDIPIQPLVLFKDDLQWADPMSPEVINSSATDIESKSLLFLGSRRYNELDNMHPLAGKLHCLKNKQVNLNKIACATITLMTQRTTFFLLKVGALREDLLAIHQTLTQNKMFSDLHIEF